MTREAESQFDNLSLQDLQKRQDFRSYVERNLRLNIGALRKKPLYREFVNRETNKLVPLTILPLNDTGLHAVVIGKLRSIQVKNVMEAQLLQWSDQHWAAEWVKEGELTCTRLSDDQPDQQFIYLIGKAVGDKSDRFSAYKLQIVDDKVDSVKKVFMGFGKQVSGGSSPEAARSEAASAASTPPPEPEKAAAAGESQVSRVVAKVMEKARQRRRELGQRKQVVELDARPPVLNEAESSAATEAQVVTDKKDPDEMLLLDVDAPKSMTRPNLARIFLGVVRELIKLEKQDDALYTKTIQLEGIRYRRKDFHVEVSVQKAAENAKATALIKSLQAVMRPLLVEMEYVKTTRTGSSAIANFMNMPSKNLTLLHADLVLATYLGKTPLLQEQLEAKTPVNEDGSPRLLDGEFQLGTTAAQILAKKRLTGSRGVQSASALSGVRSEPSSPVARRSVQSADGAPSSVPASPTVPARKSFRWGENRVSVFSTDDPKGPKEPRPACGVSSATV